MMNEVFVFFQRYRRAVSAVFMLIVLTAALAGCGQKGDLYLPNDRPKSMLQP